MIQAEITFMVYGKNGAGRIEKIILNLSHQDFAEFSNSSRNKNAKLINWAKNLFPAAKDVKIQTIIRK